MKVGSLIKKIRLLFDAEPSEPSTMASTAGPSGSTAQQSSRQPLTSVPNSTPPPKRVQKTASTSTAVAVSIKEHAECMLNLIGENAKAFVAAAEAKKFTAGASNPNTNEALQRPDVTALMLGFKLVSTAYRARFKETSRDVLRTVRAAMVSMLLKAGRDHAHQIERQRKSGQPEPTVPILSLEAAEEHLRAAEQEIVSAIAAVANSSRDSFKAFYPALSPAFGEPESGSRFAKTVEELYAKTDQALARQLGQATAAHA